MELVPYDLQLDGTSVLRLKNAVLAKAPLPEGLQDLTILRKNLLDALAKARQKHPIAKYFEK